MKKYRCEIFLPLCYGVFLYPWHAEVWYSYMPDRGTCLFMGAFLVLAFNIPVVLLSLFVGALCQGIGVWEKERRIRRAEGQK